MTKKQKIIFAVRFLGGVDITFGILSILSLITSTEAAMAGTLGLIVTAITSLFVGIGLIMLWPSVRLLKVFVHGVLPLLLIGGTLTSQFIIFGLAEAYESIIRQFSSLYGLFGISLLSYAVFIVIFFTRPSVKEAFTHKVK